MAEVIDEEATVRASGLSLPIASRAPDPGLDAELRALTVRGSLASRDGGHLRACVCCAFSDYSPYGHGLFGGMACFRDVKEAYRRVSTKQALFELWPRLSGYVQETHLCPEFELRRPGAGYRG